MLTFLRRQLDAIEEEKYPFLLGLTGILAVIFVRNIAESSLEGSQALGFSPYAWRSFYMVFVHFPLFYLSLFIWLVWLLHSLTRAPLDRIGRALVIGMAVIIIPPFLDYAITRGSGYTLTYLKDIREIARAHQFFNLFRELPEASWGQRVEIVLAMIGVFGYVVIKTGKFFKGLLGALAAYLITFLHGVVPNTVSRLAHYAGYHGMKPGTFLTGTLFSIDSQNYAAIFLLFAAIPGAVMLRQEWHRPARVTKTFALTIAVGTACAVGFVLGLVPMLREGHFLWASPLTYVLLGATILTTAVAVNVARLPRSSWPRTALAVFVAFGGVTIGPVFAVMVLLILIAGRYLKHPIPSLILGFISGVSAVQGANTGLLLVPGSGRRAPEHARQIAAWNLFLDGRYREALERYDRLPAGDLEVAKRSAMCLIRLGNVPAAIARMEVVPGPLDYEGAIILGEAYVSTGAPRRAMETYRDALDARIEMAEFAGRIAGIHGRTGETAAMERMLALGRRHGMRRDQELLVRAEYHVSRGELAAAEAAFRTARYYNGRAAAAYAGLGRIAYERGQLDSAAALLERAQQLEPRNDAIQNNLGAILLMMDRPVDARICFQKSLAIRPHQTEAHYNLGLIAERMADTVGALAAFRQALVIDPQFGPAREAMSRLGSHD